MNLFETIKSEIPVNEDDKDFFRTLHICGSIKKSVINEVIPEYKLKTYLKYGIIEIVPNEIGDLYKKTSTTGTYFMKTYYGFTNSYIPQLQGKADHDYKSYRSFRNLTKDERETALSEKEGELHNIQKAMNWKENKNSNTEAESKLNYTYADKYDQYQDCCNKDGSLNKEMISPLDFMYIPQHIIDYGIEEYKRDYGEDIYYGVEVIGEYTPEQILAKGVYSTLFNINTTLIY